MRKQYFFKPNGTAFDAWDVDRLIELATSLPVQEVPVAAIKVIDTAYWFDGDGSPATVRILVRHMELVHEADLSFPIILGADGQLMDGMHRVAKAILAKSETIRAVQFVEQPDPDHRNVRPDELPYD